MFTFKEKEVLFIAAMAAGNTGAASAAIAGYSTATAKQAAYRLNASQKIINGILLYKKDPLNDCFKIYPKKFKESTEEKKQVITPVKKLPAIANFVDEEKEQQQLPPMDGDFQIEPDTSSPLAFCKSVYSNENLDIRQRLEAAKAALPYVHAKKAEIGKKENEKQVAAAAMSHFETATPPPRVGA